MRDIRFRAWDKYDSRMFKVDTIDFKSGALSERTEPGISTSHLPEDCALMQFTGLKDKNGKEIYEGDIIETWMGVDVVRYIGNAFCPYDALDSQIENTKVIGNIYENPDLLSSPDNQ